MQEEEKGQEVLSQALGELAILLTDNDEPFSIKTKKYGEVVLSKREVADQTEYTIIRVPYDNPVLRILSTFFGDEGKLAAIKTTFRMQKEKIIPATLSEHLGFYGEGDFVMAKGRDLRRVMNSGYPKTKSAVRINKLTAAISVAQKKG